MNRRGLVEEGGWGCGLVDWGVGLEVRDGAKFPFLLLVGRDWALGRGGLESWPVVFEDPEVSEASPDDTVALTGSECDLISLTLYYHVSSRGRNLLLDRGGIAAGI